MVHQCKSVYLIGVGSRKRFFWNRPTLFTTNTGVVQVVGANPTNTIYDIRNVFDLEVVDYL
jgi:hypothetical protein